MSEEKATVLTIVDYAVMLGDGAEATRDYEFVLKTGNHQITTVMTKEEHKVVTEVLERARRESPQDTSREG